MLRLKVCARMLKNPKRFDNYEAEEKYKKFIEPRKILAEKGFEVPKHPTRTINFILTAATKRSWIKFYAYPQDLVILIAKEFSSNFTKARPVQYHSKIQVLLDSRAINVFYDLPPLIDCEYNKFVESMTVKK